MATPVVTANQSPIFGKCLAASASIIISLTVLLSRAVFEAGAPRSVGRRASKSSGEPIDASFTTAARLESSAVFCILLAACDNGGVVKSLMRSRLSAVI